MIFFARTLQLLAVAMAAIGTSMAFAVQPMPPSFLSKTLEFHGGDLIAQLSIDPTERRGNEDFMDITWFAKDGTPADPGTEFAVELWMTMNGIKHKSARTLIQRLGPNHFRVESMYFIMSGPWEITLTLKPFLWFTETQIWPVTLDSSMSVCEPLP